MFLAHRTTHITEMQCVDELKTMSLIKQKMTLQTNSNGALQCVAQYNGVLQHARTNSAEHSSDIHDMSSQSSEHSACLEQECSVHGDTQVVDSHQQTDPLEYMEQSLIDYNYILRKQLTNNDNANGDTPRTTCVALETIWNAETKNRDTIFRLCIRNLDASDHNMASETLDALQEFIFEGRQQLLQHQNPIARTIPDILTKHNIHTRTYEVDLRAEHRENKQLILQIQTDGSLRYVSVKRDNNPRETQILMHRQGHLIEHWSGNIQQIDYQCLYGSLNALFNAIYAHFDLVLVILYPLESRRDLYGIFHNMHFPDCSLGRAFTPVTVIKEQPIPNMSLSDVVYYDSNDKDNTSITKLAHMSILMNIHSQLMPAEVTFAYELARALKSDLTKLWEFREELMPRTDEYDAFQYGIVPVVQDTLPARYTEYPLVLTAPQYMKHRRREKPNISGYIHSTLTTGTNEMCTWGCAIACLLAAVKETLGSGLQYHALMAEIETLKIKINTRFMHFSTKAKCQVCNKFIEYNVQELSGGAMPLFCMVICNVLSLSCSLNNIACKQDNKTVLRRDNLILLHKTGCNKIVNMQNIK